MADQFPKMVEYPIHREPRPRVDNASEFAAKIINDVPTGEKVNGNPYPHDIPATLEELNAVINDINNLEVRKRDLIEHYQILSKNYNQTFQRLISTDETEGPGY